MFFYTNVERIGNHICIRGYDDSGQIFKKVKYKPTLFLPSRTGEGEWRDLFGKILEPIEFETISEMTKFIKTYSGVDNFEYSGMENPVCAFISDVFPDEIVYDESKIKIAIFDIEVDSPNGFPDIKQATAPIVAISVQFDNQVIVFGIPPVDEDGVVSTFTTDDPRITYREFSNEKELLLSFLELWDHHRWDIISGYNIEAFDIPYIINRIKNLLGDEVVNKLSPWRVIKEKTVPTLRGQEIETYDIVGVNILDYYLLYKKFCGQPQEQYSLNHISYVELGEKKIDYSDLQTLYQLYRKDYQKFITYNIKDSTLIAKIDKQGKITNNLFRLAFTLAYNAKSNMIDVFKQTRMWDSIIYNYLKKKKIIIPKRKKSGNEHFGGYDGAYVKEPVIGLHNWTVTLDVTSMYPHIFMTCNVGPETYVDKVKVSLDKLVSPEPHGYEQMLKERNLCMAANGTLYRKDQKSFLSHLLEKIFDERKAQKKLMIKYDTELEAKRKDLTPEQISEYQALVSRHKIQQENLKILLNACYGAVGSPGFRFFEVNQASAITITGQAIILWAERKLNEFMIKLVGKPCVIYIDTDGITVSFDELVKKYCVNFSRDQIVDFLDKFCELKIQPFLEQVFTELGDKLNVYHQKISMKREKIADKAIFTGKKRYIMNVIDQEGVKYKEPKIKVTGIESKRSSTPEIVRKALDKVFYNMLNKGEKETMEYIEQFKKEFFTTPIEGISKSMSANGISEYSDDQSLYKKATPMHVRASILFNHALDKYDLNKQYEKIKEGEKVKFCYLKQPNPIGENVIAFISICPKEFGIEEYIDYDTMWDKVFMEPLRTVLEACGWETNKTATLEDFLNA